MSNRLSRNLIKSRSHYFSITMLSSFLGWSYFLCWTVSFYPQIALNFKRKSTDGISKLFMFLNIVGFYSYSLYTAESTSLVSLSDRVFAIHAFSLSVITLWQFVIYDKITFQNMTVLSIALFSLSFANVMTLGLVKVLITILKYLPQIMKNYQRQSTKGFASKSVILDVSGGLLSLIQLIYDGLILNLDLIDIFVGNSTKLGLSIVTITMDCVLLIQAIQYKGKSNPLLPK
eukprot:NODE_245_length_12995_cov_0.297922.p4 type:complete len:231 gc:universal NODE_245_length_12995_cov_0.297922:6865-7557(+)